MQSKQQRHVKQRGAQFAVVKTSSLPASFQASSGSAQLLANQVY